MNLDITVMYQCQQATTDAFKVVYDNNTLVSDTVARSYLAYKYGAFICPDLLGKWTFYNTMCAGDFARALSAWNTDYNPLENYNGIVERLTTDDHGDEIRSHETGKDGGHNTVQALAATGTQTTRKTTTFDNDEPRTEYVDENAGGTVTTDDLYTTDTTSHEPATKTIGTETVSADIIHTEKEEKHGNLGITTNQQMLTSEIELRMNPIIQQYIDRFVYQYCFYVGGAWGCDLW